jgi:hypothetical protein
MAFDDQTEQEDQQQSISRVSIDAIHNVVYVAVLRTVIKNSLCQVFGHRDPPTLLC